VALLTLADGRRLHYGVWGDVVPDRPALVFHHGTSGSALAWDGLVGAARRAGWPVVMSSRPGYASSSRDPGRSVAAVAGDTAALLEHLGVGRFVVAGWSGGGPHALACAALLADRCAAAATLAGVAPYDAEGLDWTEGMGPENVEEFEALAAGTPGLEQRMASELSALAGVQAADLADTLGGLISPPDRACLEGGFAEFMSAWFRLAGTGADGGYWDDNVAFLKPWGFDLDAIAVPVTVWRAGQDLMVPPTHGEWLAAHVPGATGVLKAGEGHISLLEHDIDEIVDRLARDAGPL
jgi:pimeloyl-ACP methyl ester carboxylesterase